MLLLRLYKFLKPLGRKGLVDLDEMIAMLKSLPAYKIDLRLGYPLLSQLLLHRKIDESPFSSSAVAPPSTAHHQQVLCLLCLLHSRNCSQDPQIYKFVLEKAIAIS